MPLSPSEIAALQEIEESLTAGRRGRGRRRVEGLGVGVPLLAAWLLLVAALTGIWAIWGNAAALVLALTWLVLLPAGVAVQRLRYRRR